MGGSSGAISVPTFAAANPAWETGYTYSTPLDQSRVALGAGVLPNGNLLIFGGQNGEGDPLSSAYGFTGSTTAVASMNSPRAQFGYATDENHLIYAIGGQGGGRSAEVYNQATNTWTLIASLPQGLSSLSAVADGAGHVFAFGGMGGNGQISSTVYRYTIATNVWDTVAPLPVATEGSAAVLGSNGLIYVLGGITSSGTTANVESYDESTNTWTTETSLPAPVSSEGATSDSLGRIVVAGGYDVNGIPTASVYVSQQLNQPDAAPVITTTSLGVAYANQAYGQGIFSTGNPQPTYALTAAPAGMTIDSNTGLISWAPTTSQVGSYSVTVQANNYAGSTTQTYTLAVVPAAPTGLTATGASTSSIALSWNAVYDPAGVTYTVTEEKFVSNGGGKGSHGGHWVYTTIASGVTAASYTVGGLATGSSHSYYVTATDLATGIQTAASNVATAETWFPPSFPQAPAFLLSSGALWSGPVNVTENQTVQIRLLGVGNPLTYSVVSGPTTVSIDPNTGVITYTPAASELGLVNITLEASNPVGTATQTVTFNVLPTATIIFNDGPFTFNGYPFYATATAVGNDGVTPVNGTFTFGYSGPSNPPSFAGSYTVTAYFTSSDSNYGNTIATSTMIINPAPAVFGGLTSPTVPRGTTSVTLSGTLIDAAMGGGPASGTVNITLNGVTQAAPLVTGDQFSATFDTSTLAAGNYTATYVYVPGDTDFAAQNGTSTVTVTGTATPTIVFNDGPFTFNGSPFVATATALGTDGVTPVNGAFTFTYNGLATPPSAAGLYTVVANFTSSDPNYVSTTATSTMIINPATAVFSGLQSPAIVAGTTSITLSGNLADGALYPASGTVAITLNGVTQVATLGTAGQFSANFDTSTLAVGTYTATYVYLPGDTNYMASDGSSTVTVTAAAAVPTIILHDGPFTFNGSPFFATATAVGTDGVTPVNGSFTFTYNGSTSAPTAAGSYTVVANFTSSDPNYSSTSVTSTMVINPATAVFTALLSPTIPVGTTSVTLSGKLLDGTLYPTSGTVSVTLNGVTQAAPLGTGGHFSTTFHTSTLAAGPYTVTYAYVAGDPNYTAQNGTSTLYVGAKPKVTVNPKSITVTAGSTVSFTAAATGTPTPTVQWQVSINGTPYVNIAGATSTTLTFTASASQNGYHYRAVFTSSLGTVTTTIAVLTVQAPPTVTINPLSQTVVAGKRVTFTAAATGNPKPTVQWQISTDGGLTWTNIAGATATTLTFLTTLAENGYEYRALFTNIIGSAFTSAATLTV